MEGTLRQVEDQLSRIPTISVVLLGPSRHGKSTLLNALAATSVLPTSDIKPCTAAIVRLEWNTQWGIEIQFISREQLIEEWTQAVADAEEYVRRLREKSLHGEEPDDPRYLQTTLERYIQLLRVESHQPPEALLHSVRTGTIPPEIARHFGNTASSKARDLSRMRESIEKYLSTKDILWTIVDSCVIHGPFPDWHERLSLSDLPGTNDTNPHRTAITNSVRESAKGVAVVTSDSNLGPDIESWLRNSSALTNFLEGREGSYQRLMIIRTKFDAFHPEVDATRLGDLDDDAESELYRQALQSHKTQQTAAYHEMLRGIAAPLLPVGRTAEERQKLDELNARLNSIPVFFVSALAYEAFEGRLKATRSQKQRLSEHFGDDPAETGVPELRAHLNRIAEQYLNTNYYVDLAIQLQKEVDQLVRYFRKQSRTLCAEIAGEGELVRQVVHSAEVDVLPWMRTELEQRTRQFSELANVASSEIRHRLEQTSRMAERRLRDKIDKWQCYAWNSLRATARKGGCHTTSRGLHIDINQDICGVLVDDLILAWSSYRDNLIQSRISTLTQEFATDLHQRLEAFRFGVPAGDAQRAIDDIMSHIGALTERQRHQTLMHVSTVINRLESIQRPAYAIVEEEMRSVFSHVANESGQGCSERMRDHLVRGFERSIGTIRYRVTKMIDGVLEEVLQECEAAFGDFGRVASQQIEQSLANVGHLVAIEERELAERRLEHVNRAIQALPAPAA